MSGKHGVLPGTSRDLHLKIPVLLMLLAGCASNPGTSDAQSNAQIANQIANTSTQELRDPDYSHVIYRGGRDPRTGLATLRNY